MIIPPVMYWSLRTWLLTFATRWGLEVEVDDPADLDAVRGAVRVGKTTLIWVETPANPLWSGEPRRSVQGLAGLTEVGE